jgi:predicted nucleic acid-binding protein
MTASSSLPPKQAGCGTLYSEDLQHGQQFGTVRVQNPLL